MAAVMAVQVTIYLTEGVTVKELSARINQKSKDIIKKLLYIFFVKIHI